ncbi:MAG: sorbosone dehydrogenase family protein [Bradyrhizobium sp.]|uniref:PQQ-dependent sugar dehydrogenase n=1 Tax=Bradyrhizobium sp. TaxID=376 RepID=UPI001C28E481|nr:sorbosone dehydrogenase family protein [Bradyrhizobium sp.]MBU6462256.1 sorbosone dehydrogenase family protein [Pseudomonadota bacterium]MDE2067309.1 sorbosone dehydrogenase family protein [Bradyrhizobium sp.]MDE2243284.1 sorbosone dehydrogenase family protein [Bradyrhizobium sp.]MDE2471940.1 sorbosone dehydrogenase family protein [Bradyrhizobium sp.]
MLRRNSSLIWLAAAFAAGMITDAGIADALAQSPPLTGSAAFGDWRSDKPGISRLIKPEDLPKPGATPSAANRSRVVARPASAILQVPAGFKIELFAEGLSGPRQMRVAPNGDVFIAETRSGRIRILRAADGATRPTTNEIYASGLDGPFGMAFYPGGNDPKWIYVANNDSVVRFPYKAGDLRASSKPETIVAGLPHNGGHSTRDIAFSLDGKRMMISVGSRSNDAEGMNKAPEGWIDNHPLGASWGSETDRADVLTFDPDGKRLGVFATGIRNCVGLAVHPVTGDLYCSTNERDGLGDNLVPDYVTRVREGAFYGWPWFYIGDNEDPGHRGERTDLKGKITIPDVLLQAHSASLGMTFYDGNQFPAEYSGDGFAAEHGSWNRSKRTGYKVIRIRMKDGVPTGEYQDFVTGFVVDDSDVWGRPVGVAVAHDGALLVSEDANGTIWRISH